MALKQIFPKSQFPIRDYLRLWLRATGSDLLQAPREGVRWEHAWGVLLYRWMQSAGTYWGYNFSRPIDAELHPAFFYPPGILDENMPAPRKVQPLDDNTSKN